MTAYENIKIIASKLKDNAPKTQLEIIKLCKNLCIEVSNFIDEIKENDEEFINDIIELKATLTELYNNLKGYETQIQQALIIANVANEQAANANLQRLDLLHNLVMHVINADDPTDERDIVLKMFTPVNWPMAHGAISFADLIEISEFQMFLPIINTDNDKLLLYSAGIDGYTNNILRVEEGSIVNHIFNRELKENLIVTEIYDQVMNFIIPSNN